MENQLVYGHGTQNVLPGGQAEPSSPEDKAEYGIFILLYLLSGFKRWITDVKLEKTGIDENCIEQISVVKIAVDVPSEREKKKKGRYEHVQ